MATKKKATPKKRRLKIAANPDAQIIQIAKNGAVQDIHLSASATTLPDKVYWVPLDATKKWAIILTTPPDPFRNGNGPIVTTIGADARTRLLNVNPRLGGTGPYKYDTAIVTARGRLKILSGGGIIIDA